MTVLRGPGCAMCLLRSLSDNLVFSKFPFPGSSCQVCHAVITGTMKACPVSALAPVRECLSGLPWLVRAQMGTPSIPSHSVCLTADDDLRATQNSALGAHISQ